MNESQKGLSPLECSHSPDKYQEEELDPRVQVELDRLNVATDEINKLESTLEDANNSFRNELSDNSSRLRDLGSKLGSAIEKARPYFEATAEAHRLQLDCQRSAVQYHRANAVHQAARSTISLAEERFTNPNHEHHREFDPAWQEMLNHATRKVLEAEAGRSASEREHEKRAASFNEAQKKVTQLGRQLKSSISKARPYFEQKEQFDSQMQQMSERVHSLQRAVAGAKANYSQALRNLERISEEIHLQRRFNSEKREPGVGAEEIIYDEPVSKAPSMTEELKGEKSSHVSMTEKHSADVMLEEGKALVEGRGDRGEGRTVIGLSAEDQQQQLKKRDSDKYNNVKETDKEQHKKDKEEAKKVVNDEDGRVNTDKPTGIKDTDKLDGRLETNIQTGIIDTNKLVGRIDTDKQDCNTDTDDEESNSVNVNKERSSETDEQVGSLNADKIDDSIDTDKEDESIDTDKNVCRKDTHKEDSSIEVEKVKDIDGKSENLVNQSKEN